MCKFLGLTPNVIIKFTKSYISFRNLHAHCGMMHTSPLCRRVALFLNCYDNDFIETTDKWLLNEFQMRNIYTSCCVHMKPLLTGFEEKNACWKQLLRTWVCTKTLNHIEWLNYAITQTILIKIDILLCPWQLISYIWHFWPCTYHNYDIYFIIEYVP